MTQNKYGLDLAINGLWYEPFWHSKSFYVILILCILILLVWFGRFFFKKRQVKQKDLLFLVIQDLKKYRQANLNVAGQDFYFYLIAKIKLFISDKYKLQLFARTDAELKQDLLDNQQIFQIDQELIDLINQVLDRSYVVRFAKTDVVKVQIETDLSNTITVMQKVISKS